MRTAPTRLTIALAACAVTAALLTPIQTASADPTATAPVDATRLDPRRPTFPDDGIRVDVRRPVGPDEASAARVAARAALARELGPMASIQTDPMFSTVRTVARLDGFLTGPSTAPPRRVALAFVRRHLDALGLTATDLGTLAFRRDYVDALGTHHLAWTQRVDGLDAFQAGLQAAVTVDGRLLVLNGPVVPGLSGSVPPFALDRGDAMAAARVAGGAPARRATTPFDHAERVLFPTAGGGRPAWKTRVFIAPGRVDLTVVEGRTGRVLWRTNTVVTADQTGSGLAWPYYPSQTIPNGGGTQGPVTFPVANATALSGNFAHVFVDVTGRFGEPRPKDEVAAIDPAVLSWVAPATLETDRPGQNCTADWNCTWDAKVPYSWRANRRASATNTYWLLNHFHDYLQAAPIGFTEAAGNFELVNEDGAGGLDGDPMMTAAMLAANSEGDGIPRFVNNAFISPTPDGYSPYMGLLLFHKEDYGPWYPFGPGIPTSDSGVDAMVVYHEYTHGLSHRLVTTPDGEPALNSWQSASMGEAWSDWYALDLLDAEGYAGDGPGVDLPVGEYITGGAGIRQQYADCRVDSSAADCPEPFPSTGAGSGGFTYGDLGKIAGFDPHADGEIWLQTLWELRDTLGHVRTARLVTRAMELSPPNPSFLDMRNAILLADTVASGGAFHDEIWQVFAGRGMGFFAESTGDFDAIEDFNLPVTCPGVRCGRVEGIVRDADTALPVPGATVTVSGADTGIPVELSAITAADGTYRILDVPNHVYPNVIVSAPGYLRERVRDVRVAGTATVDTEIARNWAQLDGGAVLTNVTGGSPDPSCGAEQALDGDRATAWLTRPVGGVKPALTIRLPQAVDVTRIALDPLTCTSQVRFFLRGFTVFTRVEGETWTKAIVNDRPHWRRRGLTTFRLGKAGRNVSQLRLVLRSNEGADPTKIVGLAEFRVRGTAA
jgi:hypothetical protein